MYCNSCKHYVRNIKDVGKDQGSCYLNPPIPIVVKGPQGAMFQMVRPFVAGSEHCGQHSSRPEVEAVNAQPK